MESKMRKAKLLRLGVLLVLAIALYLDYFPEVTGGGLGRAGIFSILLIAFVLAVAAEILVPREKRWEKGIPFWDHDLFFIFYFIGLVALFTYVGGESQVGLSLEHPVLWIFVIYAFIKWRWDRKKYSSDKEKTNE